MSTLVQTLTFLQPVVVVPTVVRALPNVVVAVVGPLPRVAALVFVSSLQSSFMMHTSWKQLEEELDVLENIEELELKSGELEEDELMEELVEGLELSTEDDANEDDVEEEEEESVRDDEEELEEDDPSTLEEGEEIDEDDEDRVEDNDELVDEDEVWAVEEELSTLFAELEDEVLLLDRISRFEDEEEHEA